MPPQPDPKSVEHGADAESRRKDSTGALAPGLLAETYVVVFFTMEKQKLNNMVLVKYFYNLLQQGLWCQRVVLWKKGTLIAANYYFAGFFSVISLNVLYCLYS